MRFGKYYHHQYDAKDEDEDERYDFYCINLKSINPPPSAG